MQYQFEEPTTRLGVTATPLAKQRGATKDAKKTLTPERAAEPVQRAGSALPKAV